MKAVALTNSELEFIKWKVWEPLRRNQYYRNDYAKLKVAEGYFLDPEMTPKFCIKWKLSNPIDPDLSFDELYGPLAGETKKDATKRIQRLFIDSYVPESDSAAFVNLMRSCIQGDHLKVYINLTKSRLQIEGEFKKILDEWLSEKRKEFHDIKKESTSRLNKDVCEKRFEIFDLVHNTKRRWFYPDIAIKFKIHIKTVQRLHKEAWESIYKKPLPPRSERKIEIAFKTVEYLCLDCENQTCRSTGKPCIKVEPYVDQEKVGEFKIDDDSDSIIDSHSYKKWFEDEYNPED